MKRFIKPRKCCALLMLPGIASAVQGKQSSHVTTMLGSYDTNLGEFHQVELQYMRYKSSIFQSHFIQNTHIHSYTPGLAI